MTLVKTKISPDYDPYENGGFPDPDKEPGAKKEKSKGGDLLLWAGLLALIIAVIMKNKNEG